MTTPGIENVAAEIARRFDATPMRPEDRLNDEYLARLIRETATAVMQEAGVVPRKVWRGEDLAKVEHDPAGHDFTVERIGAMLAGRPPQAQGAILMELAATWLAGHPPAFRETSLALWVDALRGLIPVQEKILFGEKGHPQT